MSKKSSMNELPCPACKVPSHVDAIRCPHCQIDYSAEQVEQRKKQSKDSKRAGLFGCLGLAIVMAFGLAMCGGDEGSSATGNAKGDADLLVGQLKDAVRACDKAMTTMSASVSGGDAVAVYRNLTTAENACLSVSSEISGLDVPSTFSEEQKKSTQEALETCSVTYSGKWDATRKFKEVLDGDQSVSAQAELQDVASRLEAGTMLCALGMAGVDAVGEGDFEAKAAK